MKKLITTLIALSLLPVLAGAVQTEVIWAAQKGGPNNEWIDALDISDGHQVDTFSIPDRCHYGITWDTTYWWGGNLEDYYYRRFDDEGNIISSVLSPNYNVFGIAYDGQYLWIHAGGWAYHVMFNGTVIEPAPFDIDAMDIAWDGEYLWAVDSPSIIRRYDVDTGTENMEVWLPYPGNYGNYGITSDGTLLYISGESVIQEPYKVIWIYDKSGSYVGQIDNPQWSWNPHGLAYGVIDIEQGIESASLGRIKAIFK